MLSRRQLQGFVGRNGRTRLRELIASPNILLWCLKKVVLPYAVG
jgi:hypothetical protein